MAIPTADAGGAQTYAYATLPKLVTLDGTASSDGDGDPITAYAWTMIDKPPGSSAALSSGAVAQPTFTADLPGTYLLHLVVTAGGQQSETDLRAAPQTSYAVVTVTTQHATLKLPAYKEREWHRRMNENLAQVDALAGTVASHSLSVTALGDASDSHGERLDAAEAGVGDHETRLDAAEGTIANHDGRINSTEIDVAILAGITNLLSASVAAAAHFVRKTITPSDTNEASQVVTVTAYTPPAGKVAMVLDAVIVQRSAWQKSAVDKTVLIRVGVLGSTESILLEQGVGGIGGLYGADAGDKGDWMCGTDIGAGKIARPTYMVGDSGLTANTNVLATLDFQAGNLGSEFSGGETRIYLLVAEFDDVDIDDGATGGV